MTRKFRVWREATAESADEFTGTTLWGAAEAWAAKHWTPAHGAVLFLLVQATEDGFARRFRVDVDCEPTFFAQRIDGEPVKLDDASCDAFKTELANPAQPSAELRDLFKK